MTDFELILRGLVEPGTPIEQPPFGNIGTEERYDIICGVNGIYRRIVEVDLLTKFDGWTVRICNRRTGSTQIFKVDELEWMDVVRELTNYQGSL